MSYTSLITTNNMQPKRYHGRDMVHAPLPSHFDKLYEDILQRGLF